MNTNLKTSLHKNQSPALHPNSRLFFHTTIKTNRSVSAQEKRYAPLSKTQGLAQHYEQLFELLSSCKINPSTK